MNKTYYLLLFLLFIPATASANNIVVENVSLVGQHNDNNTLDIQFDISWDNSWYISGAPSSTANWDAAWVFAKYAVQTGGAWGNWQHCRLLNTGNVTPAGSQMSFGDTDGNGIYTGVFIYRSSAGTGSVDWDNAEIRWDYGSDGIADDAIVQVQVFAIEMTLIPGANSNQGWSGFDFYVGDNSERGGAKSTIFSKSAFWDAGDNSNPRDAVVISSTQPWISDIGDGTGTAGDITWYEDGTSYGGVLPLVRTQIRSNYPTGYNAFYLMKYEISQGQYCEFLNTLTTTQSGNRISNRFDNDRSFIKLAATGEYGCDADDDAGTWETTADFAKMNESNDGIGIACNYLSWNDVAAYADWAALRPFTELEYEKACRGPAGLSEITVYEYAWGTTDSTEADTLVNSGEANEGVSETGDGLCNYGRDVNDAALRCGFAATASTNRVQSGAGYYGNMELAGNLWEKVACIPGSETGGDLSTFEGTHGDGNLDSNGDADNSDWPGTDGLGSGYRGGGFNYEVDDKHFGISDRYYAVWDNGNTTASDEGGRCARTAP